MNTLTKVLLFASLMFLLSCGSDSKNNETSSTEKEAVENETEEKPKKEIREELLTGEAQIKIDDQEFSITEFRKNKTELTYTDESISLRLTNASDDRYVMVLLTGPQVYETRPLTIEVDQANPKARPYARVTMVGFYNKDDVRDQVVLKQGSLTINQLDEESLELDIEFEGTGGKVMDIKNEDSIPIEGSINMTVDNKIDARKKD
ncbi:invasion associated locus B family protein [Halocola ammonii]